LAERLVRKEIGRVGPICRFSGLTRNSHCYTGTSAILNPPQLDPSGTEFHPAACKRAYKQIGRHVPPTAFNPYYVPNLRWVQDRFSETTIGKRDPLRKASLKPKAHDSRVSPIRRTVHSNTGMRGATVSGSSLRSCTIGARRDSKGLGLGAQPTDRRMAADRNAPQCPLRSAAGDKSG